METPRHNDDGNQLDRVHGIADPGGSLALAGNVSIRKCPRTRRRTFTAQYKLEILAAYDAAPQGEKAAPTGEPVFQSHRGVAPARDASALSWVVCAAGPAFGEIRVMSALPGWRFRPADPSRAGNRRFDRRMLPLVEIPQSC
jgi:hypothetical protein